MAFLRGILNEPTSWNLHFKVRTHTMQFSYATLNAALQKLEIAPCDHPCDVGRNLTSNLAISRNAFYFCNVVRDEPPVLIKTSSHSWLHVASIFCNVAWKIASYCPHLFSDHEVTRCFSRLFALYAKLNKRTCLQKLSSYLRIINIEKSWSNQETRTFCRIIFQPDGLANVKTNIKEMAAMLVVKTRKLKTNIVKCQLHGRHDATCWRSRAKNRAYIAVSYECVLSRS